MITTLPLQTGHFPNLALGWPNLKVVFIQSLQNKCPQGVALRFSGSSKQITHLKSAIFLGALPSSRCVLIICSCIIFWKSSSSPMLIISTTSTGSVFAFLDAGDEAVGIFVSEWGRLRLVCGACGGGVALGGGREAAWGATVAREGAGMLALFVVCDRVRENAGAMGRAATGSGTSSSSSSSISNSSSSSSSSISSPSSVASESRLESSDERYASFVWRYSSILSYSSLSLSESESVVRKRAGESCVEEVVFEGVVPRELGIEDEEAAARLRSCRGG